MPVAAIWGTTSGYTECGNTVVIETNDGRVAVISRATFNYLYCRLNDFTAALKENCIRYEINDPKRDLMDYEEWYIDACADGDIFEECGTLILYQEDGDIAMSPKSMVLRNHKGDLKHIEAYKFHQYYDTLEDGYV